MRVAYKPRALTPVANPRTTRSPDGIEWREIPGHPNYDISEYGDIRRASTGLILKPALGPRGYLRVSLCHDGSRNVTVVHRLVCAAFNGKQPKGRRVVAHCDGNALNNHYSNLRWASHAENWMDSAVHGTAAIGERHYAAKLNWEAVREMRALSSSLRPPELAKMFGVSRTQVYSVIQNKAWRERIPDDVRAL
jgi:hypothetical protein